MAFFVECQPWALILLHQTTTLQTMDFNYTLGFPQLIEKEQLVH